MNGVQSQVQENLNGGLQSASYNAPVRGTPRVTSTNSLVLGQFNSTNSTVYLADLRITTGAGIYTGSPSSYATFTVPSAPLSPYTTGGAVGQALVRVGQNSPTIQSGALTFDRGLKQYIDFGPKTFNLATQGFTAVFRWKNTGTATNYERIFEFGNNFVNTSTCSTIAVWRDSLNLYFVIYIPGSTTGVVAGTSSSAFVQNATYVGVARYDPLAQLMTLWVNGVQVASQACTTANAADRTLATVRIGADITGTNASYGPQIARCLNGTMNTFAVYNRALSNVEIYNSYLALTTSTVNAPIEIGDANGTPALSIAGDGKVFMDSVGLTSKVLPWPPAAMTGYDTVINGGVYKARASSEGASSITWQAFDKNTTTGWVSPNSYAATAPFAYTGTVTTTDVRGTVHPGEWLQIQLGTPVVVSSYQLSTSTTNANSQTPKNWAVLGSRDGVNWFLVDSRVNFNSWTQFTYFTFNTTTTDAFSYFRIVVSQNTGLNQNVVIGEWTLYGTADTSPALTIAPATVFNTSVATPSLTGVAGSGFVPQDFSSSGLNVPAYVVSNTATVANTVAYSSFGPFAGEGSLYFPGGTGAYVNFGGSIPQFTYDWTTADFTIEGNFYPSGSTHGSDYRIFGKEANILLFIQASTRRWTFYINGITTPGGGVFVGPLVAYNEWSHVSVSWVTSTKILTISLNGSITTFSAAVGTPTYTPTAVVGFGQWVGATGAYTGYISNFRFTRGLALYTTSFTPPTGPLQPIQGVTQGGKPYGTVLLLRNAPAPGRVLTSKFGGANSGQVLSFPPAAMTSYSTALNAGYGQGVYVASASGEFNSVGTILYAYNGFTKGAGLWTSNLGYDTSTGVYTASNVTVDVTGTAYLGEWLQIQQPVSTVLSSYSLSNRTDVNYESPNTFRVFGSRDGTSWSLVNSQSGITWSAAQTKTFTVSASQAFTYYRLGVSTINAGGSARVSVRDWTLNGSIEGLTVAPDGELGVGVSNPVQALEVAGSAIVNGTLSAGNPLMFRNRLINGDFRVDQRGSGTSVPTTGYGPDRWLLSSSSTGQSFKRYTLLSASDDVVMKQGFKFGVQINRGTGGLVDLVQNVELGNCMDMLNQPMMLSFWGRSSVAAGFAAYLGISSTGSSSMTFNPGSAYSLTTNWQYITIPVPVPPVYSTSTDPTAFGIQLTLRAGGGAPNSSVQYYTGVQLEKGTVATPFEVRPYATELALCQRYYTRFDSAGATSNYTRFGAGVVDSTTGAYTLLQLPVVMRAVPAFPGNATSNSAPSTFVLSIGGSNFTVTSMSSGDRTSSVVGMSWTGTGGVARAGALAIANNTTTAYLAYDAEL